MLGDAALDVIEEGRIASEPAHGEAREEQLQQQRASASCSSARRTKRSRSRPRLRHEDVVDGRAAVRQRQQLALEDAEIALELADAAEAMARRHRRAARPRKPGSAAARRAARRDRAAAPRRADGRDCPSARAGRMVERAEGRDADLQACDLRRRQVDARPRARDRASAWPAHCRRPSRSRPAWRRGLVAERLDQHVGVLPELGVADAVEARLAGDLGFQSAELPHRSGWRRRPRSLAVAIQSIAPLRPTTQGMPSSRATMAECDSRLPRSTTIADALANSAIQPGSVWRATRISPCFKRLVRGSRTTRATGADRSGAAAGAGPLASPASGALSAPRRELAEPTMAAPRDAQPLGRVGRVRDCRHLGLAQRGEALQVGARPQSLRSRRALRCTVRKKMSRGSSISPCAWNWRPTATNRCRARPNRRVRSKRRFSRSRTRALVQPSTARSTQPAHRLAGEDRVEVAPASPAALRRARRLRGRGDRRQQRPRIFGRA